jgi:hypothetical protein
LPAAAAIRYCRAMAKAARSLKRRLAPAQLALHAETIVSVVAASVAIRLLPFPRVVAAPRVRSRGGERQGEVVRARAAVRAWCRRVPWRALCFESALALRAMLARRGIPSTLHYGIAREDSQLKAHVWLSVEGEAVIGGAEAPLFSEVATFPPR